MAWISRDLAKVGSSIEFECSFIEYGISKIEVNTYKGKIDDLQFWK